MKLIKRINKFLNFASVRTISFYTNLISGIIGGGIIAYLVLLNNVQNILNGLWYAAIIWLIGYCVILQNIKKIKSKKSKTKQIQDYIWNTTSSLIGGFYLLGLFSWKWIGPWNEIISTIGLLLIFLIIMYFRNRR